METAIADAIKDEQDNLQKLQTAYCSPPHRNPVRSYRTPDKKFTNYATTPPNTNSWQSPPTKPTGGHTTARTLPTTIGLRMPNTRKEGPDILLKLLHRSLGGATAKDNTSTYLWGALQKSLEDLFVLHSTVPVPEEEMRTDFLAKFNEFAKVWCGRLEHAEKRLLVIYLFL